MKINLFPFKCLGVAVWFPSVGDPWIASRVDFVVTAPPKAPEPPVESKKAMQEMDASYKLMSFNDSNWANPRLDSKTGAHINMTDAKAKKDYWIEVDEKVKKWMFW